MLTLQELNEFLEKNTIASNKRMKKLEISQQETDKQLKETSRLV